MDGYLKTSPRRDRSASRIFHRRRSVSPFQLSPGSSESRRVGKPRSPLRQSFRNLLTVFKRSSSKVNLIDETPEVRDDPPTLRPIRRKAAPRLPSLERNQTGRTSTGSNVQSTLWYLCQDSDKLMDSSPWVPCDAIVGTDKVSVTWISALGTPVGHDIDLTRCTDVRSLSFSHLGEREQRLLLHRGEEHQYRIFEILFEGKGREKFATASVRQRAGWINAIWDSVLSYQDAERLVQQEVPVQESFVPQKAKVYTPSEPSTTDSKPASRSLPAVPVTSLDSIPVEAAFELIKHKELPHSPETGPPDSSVDDPATTTRALSVFRKQRPQPLEQTASQSSQSSTTTRTSRFSQSTCVTTPDSSSISGEKTTRMTRGASRDSRESNRTTNSIVEAYGSYTEEQAQAAVPDRKAAGSQEPPMMFTTRSRLETIAESLHNLALQEDEVPNSKSFKAPAEEHRTSEVMVHLAQTVDANHELTTLIHQKIGTFLTDYEENNNTGAAGIRSVQGKLAELSISKKGPTLEEKDVPPLDNDRLELLNARLDDILEIIQSAKAQQGEIATKELGQQLAKIISLVKEDKGRRKLVEEQQNESVRYLNELNQWFENFVENGTSHFQDLSAGMDKLCKVLYGTSEKPGIVVEIRQMNQVRTLEMEKIDELQRTVGKLASLVRHNSESNGVSEVVQLLEAHRKDQIALVRHLSQTLTEEIRGERLRFVDAMKEATAINVHGHVEQFKKELKREVKTMNEEVDRLHQARQAMQNQIADLFGFYDKHSKRHQNAYARPQERASTMQAPHWQHQEVSSQHRGPRAHGSRPLPQPR